MMRGRDRRIDPLSRRERNGQGGAWRLVEFLLLFGGVPALHAADLLRVHPFVVLWITSAFCLVMLLLDSGFDKRTLWRGRRPWREHRAELGLILTRFAWITPIVLVAVALISRDRLFSFPRHWPGLWALVMCLYPIFSVYPQGVIYRAFLLHRYRDLITPATSPVSAALPRRAALVAALAFAYMHMIFRNPLAPALTLVGGYLFTRTHQKTGSLIVSSIEHAFYGCLLFTAGWGRYFYETESWRWW